MNKVFTQEELVKYVCNEVSIEEKFLIEETLKFDLNLRAELETLKETMKMLDIPKLSPKKSTVDNILNFSKSYSVRNTRFGDVEMTLN